MILNWKKTLIPIVYTKICPQTRFTEGEPCFQTLRVSPARCQREYNQVIDDPMNHQYSGKNYSRKKTSFFLKTALMKGEIN